MKKKLGISLREPVKIYHADNQTAADAPIESQPPPAKSETRDGEISADSSVAAVSPATTFELTNAPKTAAKIPAPRKISAARRLQTPSALEMMSERTFEIWKCLLEQAATDDDNQVQRSFTVTRAQVMSAAKVGSTNTYRLALQKLQELDLLVIELRPGVTSGSVFHLTDKGIELSSTMSAETAND